MYFSPCRMSNMDKASPPSKLRRSSSQQSHSHFQSYSDSNVETHTMKSDSLSTKKRITIQNTSMVNEINN